MIYDTGEELYIAEMKQQIFDACLKQLREEDQKLLLLRFEGNSSKQIGDKLGKNANAVNQAMFACRKRLKDLIIKHPEYIELSGLAN